MALTSSSVKYRGHFEPLLGGVHFVPFPDPLRVGGGPRRRPLDVTMAALDELFATLVYPDDVAAFIVEPILGEGGYVVPPDGFLPALREVADRHGILLIADEIQTGYGRTGRFFASEWTDATPDIVSWPRALRPGCRCRGIMARRSLHRRVRARRARRHVRRQRRRLRRGAGDARRHRGRGSRRERRATGDRLLAGLRAAADGVAGVADVRGRGLMVAIEFAEPDRLKPRPDLAKALLAEALERKLLLLTCGTYGQAVRVIPPLVTTDDEVELAGDGNRRGARGDWRLTDRMHAPKGLPKGGTWLHRSGSSTTSP